MLVCELYLHAEADAFDASGTTVPSTGGSLLYLTPRLLVDLGRGIVLRGALQVPALRRLNGVQCERAVVNVGLVLLGPR